MIRNEVELMMHSISYQLVRSGAMLQLIAYQLARSVTMSHLIAYQLVTSGAMLHLIAYQLARSGSSWCMSLHLITNTYAHFLAEETWSCKSAIRYPWLLSYVRYNIDMNIRAYFVRGGAERSTWPLCLDMDSYGIFLMDPSMNSTQNHSAGSF